MWSSAGGHVSHWALKDAFALVQKAILATAFDACAQVIVALFAAPTTHATGRDGVICHTLAASGFTTDASVARGAARDADALKEIHAIDTEHAIVAGSVTTVTTLAARLADGRVAACRHDSQAGGQRLNFRQEHGDSGDVVRRGNLCNDAARVDGQLHYILASRGVGDIEPRAVKGVAR